MDEQNLSILKGFLKQFKTKEKFSPCSTIFKEGVEEMLNAELDERPSFEKHREEGHNTRNRRHGSYSVKVKLESLGDTVLNLLREPNQNSANQNCNTVVDNVLHRNL